jgi:hypothetical protein
LNDYQEFSGFLDTRLRKILNLSIQESNSKGPKVEQDFNAKVGIIYESIRQITLDLDAFVTSFCSTDRASGPDGLLSQWRGYGKEGGYAVILATKYLEELASKEAKSFLYGFVSLSDVDYYNQRNDEPSRDSDTLEREAQIKEMFDKVLSTIRVAPIANAVDTIINEHYSSLVYLASRHKHHGFREENEIRLTALRYRESKVPVLRAAGAKEPLKSVHFREKHGVLIPYIKLFESVSGKNKERLPITKIIVGPHRDIEKRSRSVRALLAQNGISAPVIESQIPYVGS